MHSDGRAVINLCSEGRLMHPNGSDYGRLLSYAALQRYVIDAAEDSHIRNSDDYGKM